MIFKLCLGQQIHRCPKSPTSYEALVAAVKQTFKDSLPGTFKLCYVDQDGDRVLLYSEDDFQSMIASNDQKNQSIKIFIMTEEQSDISEAMKTSTVSISKIPMAESYLILNTQEEPKVIEEQPVIEKVIEVPVLKEEKVESNPEPVVQKNPVEVEAVIEVKQPEEQPKKVDREEVKEDGRNAPVIAEDDEHIDLSNKPALRAFIIQTIEEAMPQIMANYLNKNTENMKPKKEASMMTEKIASAKTTLKDVATEVVNELSNLGGMVSKGVERIVIGEKDGLSSKLTKVEKIMPEVITNRDEQLYATITIRNNGTQAFPQTCFLQSVGGLYGDMIKLPPLESRKEWKTVLNVKGPKRAGNYVSRWRTAYIDERNMTKLFGDEFEVKFSVIDKKYSVEVQQKARQLKELIPQTDIETFLEFVNQDPKKSIEILVEEYILNNPSV